MDQRFAVIPNWDATETDAKSRRQIGAAMSDVRAAGQRVAGFALNLAAIRPIGERWWLSGHVFYDQFHVSSSARDLPLAVPFAQPPLQLPAVASFGGLGGRIRDFGGALMLHRPWRWRGVALQWNLGVEWQRLRLEDFASSYRIGSGASAGTSGIVDFSGSYTHVSPLAGLAASWVYPSWRISPHALFALPLPKRGTLGRIQGPGFDLAGDSAENGFGKHFGDPFLALGCEIEYRPWRLSVDAGALLAQRIVEPAVHKGIDEDWLLSFAWRW